MKKQVFLCINKRIYFSVQRNYKQYKIPFWYHRSDNYNYIVNDNYYKNYEIEYNTEKNFLRLFSELNDSQKLKITRDYYNTSQYEEYIEDTEDKVVIVENSVNKNKTGVFWLYGGNNLKMHVSYLLEFDNFLPKPFKNKISFETDSNLSKDGNNMNDIDVTNLFYLHTQLAPFNPVTNTTFVQENNYFNILDYPGLSGERNLNYSEIDFFTELIEEQILNFIKEKEIDNIVIGGFSQGACMALHTCLKTKNSLLIEKIKGVIAFNGFLFKHTPIDYERFKNLSFLLVNGLQDDVVLLREAESSYLRLSEKHNMYKESFKSFFSKENNFKEKIISKKYGSIEQIKENGLHHSFSKFGLEKAHDFIKAISQDYNALKVNTNTNK